MDLILTRRSHPRVEVLFEPAVAQPLVQEISNVRVRLVQRPKVSRDLPQNDFTIRADTCLRILDGREGTDEIIHHNSLVHSKPGRGTELHFRIDPRSA